MKKLIYITILSIAFLSCKKDKKVKEPTTNTSTKSLGWSGTDNPNIIPSFLGSFGNSNNTTNPSSALPSSIDLSIYMPPVKNQQYGTCVAWATGYCAKSISEAVKNGYTQAQLTSTDKQLSPRDLFTSIEDQYKPGGCDGGTQIFYALAQLQSRGVATEAIVPSLVPSGFSCNKSNLQSSWNTSASGHKIKYYRKVEQSVAAIKKCLAGKVPIVFGADIGGDFDSYTGGVIGSNASFTPSRGGHAMALVGYDDAKQAFKIANSWGTQWGENGFAWMNYSAFLSFVRPNNLYMFSEETSLSNTVNSGTPDLAPWVFSDINNTPISGIQRQRKIQFNLYNVGNGTAQPSSKWDFYYVYYNAFNANDYGILFADKFDLVGANNSYTCPTPNNCTFNYALTGGSDFANVVFGNTSVNRTYNMPNISGQYFLVLFADATSQIGEQSELNNLFYTTGQTPLTFANGVAKGNADMPFSNFKNTLTPNRSNLQNSKFNSAVNNQTEITRNAYTPEEMINFLKSENTTGRLNAKIQEFKLRQQ